MRKLLVSLCLLPSVLLQAQVLNAVQTGLENSYRTADYMTEVSYPVMVVDNGNVVEITNFADYGSISITVNDDLTVNVSCGQMVYDLGLSENDMCIYGNACIYAADVDGFHVVPNTTVSSLTGTLKGNTITIDNPDSEGYFWLCSKLDADGKFYSLGLFAAQAITLNEGVFTASDPSGVEIVLNDSRTDNRVFTVDGRLVDTDKNALDAGLYIQNGRKFVKH